MSLLLGIAIAMPMLMYQLLAFVAPGLTKQERRWLYPIVIGASLMFVLGMAFAYYVELPPALNFLLDPKTDDVEPTIGVQTYIDTVTRLLLVTGLVFEMPFVIMGLAKIGVVTSRQLLGWWRYAILCCGRAGGHRDAVDRPGDADGRRGANHRAVLRRHRPGEAGRGQQLPRGAPRVDSPGQPVAGQHGPDTSSLATSTVSYVTLCFRSCARSGALVLFAPAATVI